MRRPRFRRQRKRRHSASRRRNTPGTVLHTLAVENVVQFGMSVLASKPSRASPRGVRYRTRCAPSVFGNALSPLAVFHFQCSRKNAPAEVSVYGTAGAFTVQEIDTNA